MMRTLARTAALVAVSATAVLASSVAHASVPGGASPVSAASPASAATAAGPAAARPNIFFYNMDDLRDALPNGVDPLSYMPKLQSWMEEGTRYQQNFVAVPACTPSRASLFTGRLPHSNGVLRQHDAPLLDTRNTYACSLQKAGYVNYLSGKFLTTWSRTIEPPCYDHSTVMYGGYNNVLTKVDGQTRTLRGYSTNQLGNVGRDYIADGLATGQPFMLYEATEAPHTVPVKQADGTSVDLAVPEPKYADAPVSSCVGTPEANRGDKPAYVRHTNVTAAEAQRLCESQIRSILSADDQFDRTMSLLQADGVLDDTLVIFSSDNGYNWGEHGRTAKFVPYDPSMRVPLLMRWPGHIAAGVDHTRLVSYIDVMPTILEAAGISVPASAPQLEGESLLEPSHRTMLLGEYSQDSANGSVPTWKSVRTLTDKYVETYDASGDVIATEYYDLIADPDENLNLLGDKNTANDPPAWVITNKKRDLQQQSTCTGAACVA